MATEVFRDVYRWYTNISWWWPAAHGHVGITGILKQLNVISDDFARCLVNHKPLRWYLITCGNHGNVPVHKTCWQWNWIQLRTTMSCSVKWRTLVWKLCRTDKLKGGWISGWVGGWNRWMEWVGGWVGWMDGLYFSRRGILRKICQSLGTWAQNWTLMLGTVNGHLKRLTAMWCEQRLWNVSEICSNDRQNNHWQSHIVSRLPMGAKDIVDRPINTQEWYQSLELPLATKRWVTRESLDMFAPIKAAAPPLRQLCSAWCPSLTQVKTLMYNVWVTCTVMRITYE